MAEIREKIKKIWETINYPDNLDPEFDRRCDDDFNNFFDKIVNFCYFLYFVAALVSIYFLITREIL